MDENIKPVYEAILEGDMGAATEGVQNALDAGTSAADLLHKALIPAMSEVGYLNYRIFEIFYFVDIVNNDFSILGT